MYQRVERQEQEREKKLPPSKPKRPLVETYHPDSLVWNSELALNRLVDVFDDRNQQEAILECAKIVEAQSSGRWQLGYEAITSYDQNGDLHLRFPTKKELGRHNRYRHQVGVGHDVAVTAMQLGLSEEDAFIGGIAGLIHDYEHTLFSHSGERAFKMVYDKLKGSNPDIAGAIESNGFHRTHEDRLQEIVFSSKHPLGKLIHETLPIENIQKLARTLEEQGDLGLLLKLCDTAQYLNMDSLFYGYTPPNFEKFLPDALSLEPFGLVVSGERGSQIISNMLTYRGYFYKFYYEHPFNDALVRMQSVAIGEYFFGDRDESGKLAGFEALLHGALTSDADVIDILRRRTLTGTLSTGISFFGLLFPKVVPSSKFEGIGQNQVRIIGGKEVNGKSVTVKTISGSMAQIVPGIIEPLPECQLINDGTVFEGSGDVFEDTAKLIAKLCQDDAFIYGRDSASISGMRQYFNASPAKKRGHPERSKIDRVLSGDFQVSYRLSDMVE